MHVNLSFVHFLMNESHNPSEGDFLESRTHLSVCSKSMQVIQTIHNPDEIGEMFRVTRAAFSVECDLGGG